MEKILVGNEEFDINFVARFACLIEGVNIAYQKARQLGMEPEKQSDWIKPLAFQKYIEERQKDMVYQIEQYYKNGEKDE